MLEVDPSGKCEIILKQSSFAVSNNACSEMSSRIDIGAPSSAACSGETVDSLVGNSPQVSLHPCFSRDALVVGILTLPYACESRLALFIKKRAA